VRCIHVAVIMGIILVGGVMAEAQGLTIEWKTNLHFLPTTSLDYMQFKFDYGVSGWELEGTFQYTGTGLVDVSFQADGELGPFDLSAGLAFDPLEPEIYESGYFKAALIQEGFGVTGKVEHYAEWPCDPPSPYMLYTLELEAGFASVRLLFDDCSHCTRFKEAIFKLEDISFCCGIACDAQLSFTGEGFNYLKFKAEEVFGIWSAITFDVELELGVDHKSVTLDPKSSIFGAHGCFTLYGDVQLADGATLGGLLIYGYKISCEIGDCSELELVTAFMPDKVPEDFKEDEFEVVRLSLCAPACCGQQLEGKFAVFFSPSGGLLGISRMMVETQVPFSDNLAVEVAFETATSFDVGWRLRF